jgi:hypothetical protein
MTARVKVFAIFQLLKLHIIAGMAPIRSNGMENFANLTVKMLQFIIVRKVSVDNSSSPCPERTWTK